MDWYSTKILALEQTNLSRDALNIFNGLAGQILAAVVRRRSLAHPVPRLAHFPAQLANEYFDLTEGDIWDKPMWPGSVRALLVTMALPTLLLILVRYSPGLFVRSKARKRT